METWSLPKARPISCNDCPAFQRLHMSVRWFAESFTRLTCVMNTTFRKKIYSRWCCIDRLSRHCFSGVIESWRRGVLANCRSPTAAPIQPRIVHCLIVYSGDCLHPDFRQCAYRDFTARSESYRPTARSKLSEGDLNA